MTEVNLFKDGWVTKSITCQACKETDTVEYDPFRWQLYMGGELVQNVWPESPASYREKIIGVRSGYYICNDCWHKEMGED